MEIGVVLNWLTDSNFEYTFRGDTHFDIMGFSSLNRYKAHSITWIRDITKYEMFKEKITFDENKPVCAVVKKGLDVNIANVIYTDNPKEVFFSILHHFWGDKVCKGCIGEGSFVSRDATLDKTVSIGNNCSITGKITIGENSVIENNVVIQGNVKIGANCIVHSGTVIGGDGFGYYFDEDGSIGKVEHFGGVEIGDFVEIGCNACIDRGTIDDTVIGNNSKIDNLVHIAHNAYIGENVCVVAGAVVCGSALLQDGSYVAPGGIVKNQTIIGNNSFVGLGAVVTKPVEKETVVIGVPARPIRKVERGDK